MEQFNTTSFCYLKNNCLKTTFITMMLHLCYITQTIKRNVLQCKQACFYNKCTSQLKLPDLINSAYNSHCTSVLHGLGFLVTSLKMHQHICYVHFLWDLQLKGQLPMKKKKNQQKTVQKSSFLKMFNLTWHLSSASSQNYQCSLGVN